MRRIATGLTLAAGVVLLLVADHSLGTPAGSFLVVSVLAVLALAEALALFRRAGEAVWVRAGVIGAVLFLAARAAVLLLELETGATTFGWIVGSAFAIVVATAVIGGHGAGLTAFTTVWVVGSLLSLLELRLISWPGRPDWGLGAVAVVVAVVKGGDTAAYFVGRTIGRRPMAPRISPRKTWEGAAASFVLGTALAPILGLGLGLTPDLGVAEMLVLGAAASVAGQVGDLAESYLKRRAGAKDSGHYLGELGGALDVLDAFLLAGPVAYVVIHLLAPWGRMVG